MIATSPSDNDPKNIFNGIMGSREILSRNDIEDMVWDIISTEEDYGRCPEHALTDFIMALRENHATEWIEAYRSQE